MLKNPLKLRHCPLKRKSQCQLGMLQHMIEAQKLNLILGGVNLVVGVAEFGLDDKSGRVAILASRGVVGASVAALGQDKGDITVLRKEEHCC